MQAGPARLHRLRKVKISWLKIFPARGKPEEDYGKDSAGNEKHYQDFPGC